MTDCVSVCACMCAAVVKFPHIMLIAEIHAIVLLGLDAAPESMPHLFLYAVARNSAR